MPDLATTNTVNHLKVVQKDPTYTPEPKDLKKDCAVANDKIKLIPFLKWAGGKRWLVQKHPEVFNIKYNRYIEPFVGSAAVFFHLQPTVSILADKNKNLIETYNAIKNDYKKVFKELRIHQVRHCENYYYDIRGKKFRAEHKKAAQFLYLNRTCWNGLYRVNQNNVFNVPKGTKNNVILDTDNFEETAKLLQRAQIVCSDFCDTINQAECGDLLFIDPPYTVKHDKNGFIKYNETIFSWEDQVRLRDAAVAAKRRGAKIIITNANHDSVKDLYKDNFRIEVLDRASVLSGKKEKRGPVKELLIR